MGENTFLFYSSIYHRLPLCFEASFLITHIFSSHDKIDNILCNKIEGSLTPVNALFLSRDSPGTPDHDSRLTSCSGTFLSQLPFSLREKLLNE